MGNLSVACLIWIFFFFFFLKDTAIVFFQLLDRWKFLWQARETAGQGSTSRLENAEENIIVVTPVQSISFKPNESSKPVTGKQETSSSSPILTSSAFVV